eukprot:4411729-Pleurochrysis_carterae.AAC.1
MNAEQLAKSDAQTHMHLRGATADRSSRHVQTNLVNPEKTAEEEEARIEEGQTGTHAEGRHT